MRSSAILIGLVCLFMAGPANAQNPDWWVRCGGPFQLCGYVERGTSEPRLPFRYEAAKPFQDGLAAVRIEGRWGYIDPQGNLAIAPVYAEAMAFRGGLAEVRVNGSAGVIDRTGRVVLAPQFERAIPFVGTVFIAVPEDSADDSWSWGGDDVMSLNSFGDAGLYDLHRGWLTDTGFKFTTFDDPGRGLLWAGRGELYREVWGLLRTDGSWQVPPQYSYVQRLIGGRAIVRSLVDDSLPVDERSESINSGAVNADGELVVPFERRWLGAWRGQYAAAGRLGAAPGVRPSDDQPESGFVSLDGELLGGRYFDEISVTGDGSLPRVRLGSVWYSLSASGELLPDQLDGTTLLECPDGRTLINRGGQVEVRRRSGEVVGLFEKGYRRASDCGGDISLSRDDRYYVLTSAGDLIGDGPGFEDLQPFNGGIAAAKRDGKWGLIDRLGRFVVSPSFDDLRPAGAGLFRALNGDGVEWIDGAGQPVARPPETRLTLECPGGLILFKSGERWGMRDADDNLVVRAENRVINCFSHGSAWAVTADGREWCPVGPDGERQAAYRCRQEVYPTYVTHHVPESFHDDPFESSVLWNLARLDFIAGDRPEPPGWVPDGNGHGSYSTGGGLPIPERVDAEGEALR